MTSPSKDIQAKMAKIRGLTDAIQRARVRVEQEPSVEASLALQDLQKQRQELQGLIPKPKAVS